MIYDEVVNEYDFDPENLPPELKSWNWVPWEPPGPDQPRVNLLMEPDEDGS